MLYSIIKHELQHLSTEILKIQKQLLDFPPGHLLCFHNGKYVKLIQSEPGKQTLIPKKNIPLAQQLASKKYLTSLLSDLKFEKEALQDYLIHYDNFSPQVNQFLNHPIYPTLLPQTLQPQSETLSVWANEPYIQNSSHLDQLKYHSVSGNVLRSKSEVFIDQILYRKSIPYRYECLLAFGEYSLFPDFTIRNPQSGELFY